MPKNKFIKFLKIICVLAPIFFAIINTTISYIGSAISLSGVGMYNSTISETTTTDTSNPTTTTTITTTTSVTNDSGLIENALTWHEEVSNLICNSLVFCTSLTSLSPILNPIYNVVDWTFTNFLGLPFQEITSALDGDMVGLIFPIFFILIIFWYLIVELIFFIPEVLILFIRWCKNLMYKFMDKSGGGF